jgi:hypothetical protein
MLLGYTRDAGDYISTRGDLDGHSYDWAFFAQDDWRVNDSLTVFLGVRWELVGIWSENEQRSPTSSRGPGLPRGAEPGSPEPDAARGHRARPLQVRGPGRRRRAPAPRRQEQLQPTRRLRYRLGGGQNTVLRGGFGLFHPTVAIQGLRDLMATNQFRYALSYTGGGLAHAYSQGTTTIPLDFFGTDGVDPNIKAPDIYQYNLSLEHVLPGDLGPARQLHRLDRCGS